MLHITVTVSYVYVDGKRGEGTGKLPGLKSRWGRVVQLLIRTAIAVLNLWQMLGG